MGMLVDGKWHTDDLIYAGKDGRFKRKPSPLRNWVTADGSPGPTGEGGYRAEPGRYHLYVSWACPWAHRTLIFRALKGLEEMIPISVVHWYISEDGWTFKDAPGVIPDTVNGTELLRDVYVAADPAFTGRVTVPVLWDKQTGKIVSNESADIIRMFNSAFDTVGAKPGDYYPQGWREEIDALNTRIYETVNNGVYRAGFATSQTAYDAAVVPLFETLDWLEERLATRRYLTGARLTEADVRLVTTLFRFDLVYHGHFKCNRRRIADYPNLWAYARDLYQHPGVAETVDFRHITRHYHESHRTINPCGIVPIGPDLDWREPHGREDLSAPRRQGEAASS